MLALVRLRPTVTVELSLWALSPVAFPTGAIRLGSRRSVLHTLKFSLELYTLSRRNPANRPLSKKLRRDIAQILKRCGHFIACEISTHVKG